MKAQEEIFKLSEGDKMFSRNLGFNVYSIKGKDRIVKALSELEIEPKSILEIGCSNGIRLNKLNKTFGSQCYGIDPSAIAIANGKRKFKNIEIKVGTADLLEFTDNYFDMIIFGFCLYLCDRKHLFKIAYEVDRCLCDKGYIVIMDFYPSFPFENSYLHNEEIYCYKMKYDQMFLWNPVYNEYHFTLFSHEGSAKRDIPNEKVGITVLKKCEEFAYSFEPKFRDQ